MGGPFGCPAPGVNRKWIPAPPPSIQMRRKAARRISCSGRRLSGLRHNTLSPCNDRRTPSTPGDSSLERVPAPCAWETRLNRKAEPCRSRKWAAARRLAPSFLRWPEIEPRGASVASLGTVSRHWCRDFLFSTNSQDSQDQSGPRMGHTTLRSPRPVVAGPRGTWPRAGVCSSRGICRKLNRRTGVCGGVPKQECRNCEITPMRVR